jgi:CRP-like cAMP-binding protein
VPPLHRPRAWGEAERAALLGAAPTFRELPPATIRVLAAGLRPRRVARDAFLFLAGEPAATFHLLAAGRVKVIRETEDGREVILRLIEPGEIFGGAGVWGEAAYPASAVAAEEAVVLQMPARDFAALVQAQPGLALVVIRELAHRLREAEARIRELQTERVERRIARVLLRLANKTGARTERRIELGVPLSRQDLAELAGTTLSTASRTVSAWDQQGIVETGRERIVILDRHALVGLAEDLPAPRAPVADPQRPRRGAVVGTEAADSLR